MWLHLTLSSLHQLRSIWLFHQFTAFIPQILLNPWGIDPWDKVFNLPWILSISHGFLSARQWCTLFYVIEMVAQQPCKRTESSVCDVTAWAYFSSISQLKCSKIHGKCSLFIVDLRYKSKSTWLKGKTSISHLVDKSRRNITRPLAEWYSYAISTEWENKVFPFNHVFLL